VFIFAGAVPLTIAMAWGYLSLWTNPRETLSRPVPVRPAP